MNTRTSLSQHSCHVTLEPPQQSYDALATCARGFESLLAAELARFEAKHIRPLVGQVSFTATQPVLYRCMLGTRLASRILVLVARIAAKDADELYAETYTCPWDQIIAAHACISFKARGTNQALTNTKFIAQKCKDAVVDKLREHRKSITLEPAHPNLSIMVRVHNTKASLWLDLCHEALFFERGHVRSDYATALCTLASADEKPRPSDTAAISATMLASVASTDHLVIASPDKERLRSLAAIAQELLDDHSAGVTSLPLGRESHAWPLAGWLGHNQSLFEQVMSDMSFTTARGSGTAFRSEATSLSPSRTLSETAPSDALQTCYAAPHNISKKTVTLYTVELVSKALVSKALVSKALVSKALVSKAPTYPKAINEQSSQTTCLIVDAATPKNTTLVDQALLVRSLIELTRQYPADKLLLCAYNTLPPDLLAAPLNTREVFLGQDMGHMSAYQADDWRGAQTLTALEVPVIVAGSDQFANRLKKSLKLKERWAKREGISAWRLYDADLLDYNLAIEIFDSTSGGRYVVVSEYAPPKHVDQSLAYKRLLDALVLIAQYLQVPVSHITVRTRLRAKGGSQYAHIGKSQIDVQKSITIDEGGLDFEINFSARLDCGLFLDHRETRAYIREMMKQTKGSKRFLNLFAYTGSATCYAADGGARYTTTVDLSRPSLEWAKRNMKANGFTGPTHEFIQADALSWIKQERHSNHRWDLIFCDVPTFSNSKDMKQQSFDVQRDHAELIIAISRLLIQGGTAIFSCNLRNFKPDYTALAKAGVNLVDITEKTIPQDFARTPNIHHCYLVSRTPRS